MLLSKDYNEEIVQYLAQERYKSTSKLESSEHDSKRAHVDTEEMYRLMKKDVEERLASANKEGSVSKSKANELMKAMLEMQRFDKNEVSKDVFFIWTCRYPRWYLYIHVERS